MTVLTCEKCDTKFEVPETALAGGRKVRCTSCQYIWFQEDPAAPPESEFERELKNYEAEAVEGAAPRPADNRKIILTEDEETRKLSTRAALLVFAALVLIAGILFIAIEDKLIRYWPESAGIYSAIGLKPDLPWAGLRMTEGTARIITTEGEGGASHDVLMVEGIVHNITDKPRTVPPFRIELIEKEGGALLQYWEPAAEDITLPPGGTQAVKWGFTDPPDADARVKIFFRHFD